MATSAIPPAARQAEEISPLTRSRELIPLMVVTGGNDPRVPASEADQMVEGGPRQRPHRLAPARQNEGHGFAKKENQDYLFWTSLMFWQQNLLGGSFSRSNWVSRSLFRMRSACRTARRS
jgi:dipeptidyl aminopeptidase/acylaminoacyl peptidase